MRKILLICAGLLLVAGHASATTYQFTYTSSKLLTNPPYKAIKGATRLTLVVTSPTSFPRNACFQMTPTSFSDGVDTLATLAAAGYSDQFSPPSIQACTDRTGKHVLQWQVFLRFTKPTSPGLADIYTVAANYPAQNSAYYDEAQFENEHQNPRKSVYMWNVAIKTGLWKYKVLN